MFVGMKNLFGIENTSTKDAKLILYSNSSGGDMCGSSSCTRIKACDDNRAEVLYSSRKMHNLDCEVNEYYADAKILEEIEAVFRKHNMEKWNNKKFTDMFVCDGASYSYRFEFDNRANIAFSSQVYPAQYRDKLNEIDTAIEKYRESFVRIPGLVKEEMSDEEFVEKQEEKKANQLINLEVFEYSAGKIQYRIINGTDDIIKISTGTYKLFCEESDEMLVSMDSTYSDEIHPRRLDTGYISEVLRLEAGKYRLEVGGENKLTCTFEIA